MIAPDGTPFFSLGVVHTGAYADGEGQLLFRSKYNQDWGCLAEKIAGDLKRWGFNTAGYHSPITILDYMPYLQDSYPARISYWMGKPSYPDVFDPAYQREVEDILKNTCRPVRDHPNLVGYYWTDTPQWDLSRARARWGTDWVSAIRALPASAPGKQEYIHFLEEVCAGTSESLLDSNTPQKSRAISHKMSFAQLSLTHPLIVQHDQEFLRCIARRYYSVAHQATRLADPRHLIFGDRYIQGDHPEAVIAEALPYIDVLSIQPIEIIFNRPYFDQLYALTGKPILICDHAINFPTNDHPQTVWPQCATEKEASQAYAAYLRALLTCPFIVGYHRCQYIDRVVTGTDLLKQGLLRADETPYRTLITGIIKANLKIQKLSI